MLQTSVAQPVTLNDPNAFVGMIEAYNSAVFNFCYRMLGEAREAEDAVQESFMRAYEQFHRYDQTRSFKTWLFSIAYHHCIDRLRRRRMTWLDIEDEALAGELASVSRTPGPEDIALQREQTRRIQAMLARLSPADRAAIVMRYWYDLSYEEIAQVTHTTASAVKSRLHRARGALAGMLRPERVERPALRLQTASLM